MTCPVGWDSALGVVLWEFYGYIVKRAVLIVLTLILGGLLWRI